MEKETGGMLRLRADALGGCLWQYLQSVFENDDISMVSPPCQTERAGSNPWSLFIDRWDETVGGVWDYYS